MPNWCECDLTVSGPAARLQEFLGFAKGDNNGLDFNRFIPYPEKFRRLDEATREWERDHPRGDWRERPKDGFNSGGYEWCWKHWGTKWNAGRVETDSLLTWGEDGEVELHFSTAWSPPLPVIRKASEKYPELQFELRYFERGCGFNGLYRCRAGEVLDDESGPYFGNRGG